MICGPDSQGLVVRGSLLMAVMIQLDRTASTRGYHSEVGSLVTKHNTFLQSETCYQSDGL